MDNELLIDSSDTIRIILFAIGITGVAEIASFFLIYRKDEYINLKKNIEVTTSKLTKQKDSFVNQANKQAHEKKVSQIETQLKAYNQEMSFLRMKSTVLIAIFMIITVSSLGTLFQGIVVARIPFVPFGLIQGITHRGLVGEDYTHCSYIFIYILTTFVVRTNIHKIFGFEPPRSAISPFGPTPPQF